jgi:AmmeMemoRadiSam system protein A
MLIITPFSVLKGYNGAAIRMNLSHQQQDVLLDLARDSIRRALANEPAPPLPGDPQLNQPAGCFVSLHRMFDHRLRGCVGRLDAKGGLAQTVALMARGVLEDPRFLTSPVTAEELSELEIELSILSPLMRLASPEEFDPATSGVYVTYGGRNGCFLPQVARDTGWNREQLLDRLCTEKLGVPADTWRKEGATIYRFTALLVGPEPFMKLHHWTLL